jgi:flagellar hook-length control protein FliK
MPQVQGDKLTSAAPAKGGDLITQLTANGEIIGANFEQALQELLMTQGEEGVLLLSLATTTSDPLQNQAITAQNGSLLPLQLHLDGKPLPLMLSQQPTGLSESALDGGALAKPLQAQPQLMQPEFLVQRLTESGQSQLQPLKIELSAIGKQLLDAGRPVETTGQLSAISLQPLVNSSTGIRPSIVMPMDIPVGQAGWDRGIGERIQWMVGQNIQHAEIKLNPPNLGPLEIKISLQNDQTNVTFVATQAPTRDAIEASIPRLREMFGEINLNLANVDVGQQQAGESTRDGSAESAANDAPGGDLAGQESSATEGGAWVRGGSDGLLDTYA